MNFAPATEVGDVDLLGELTGVGRYADVVRDAVAHETQETFVYPSV